MKNDKSKQLKRRLISWFACIVSLVFLVALFGDLGLLMTIILAFILYEHV